MYRRNQEIVAAIGSVVRDVIRMEPSFAAAQLNECRERLLEACGDTVAQTEIKRRVSEAKVQVLHRFPGNVPFQDAWGEIETLGYSTPERELTMVFYRLLYRAKSGASEPECRLEFDRLRAIASRDRGLTDQYSDMLAGIQRVFAEEAAR